MQAKLVKAGLTASIEDADDLISTSDILSTCPGNHLLLNASCGELAASDQIGLGNLISAK